MKRIDIGVIYHSTVNAATNLPNTWRTKCLVTDLEPFTVHLHFPIRYVVTDVVDFG
jgi:hypothetical protein